METNDPLINTGCRVKPVQTNHDMNNERHNAWNLAVCHKYIYFKWGSRCFSLNSRSSNSVLVFFSNFALIIQQASGGYMCPLTSVLGLFHLNCTNSGRYRQKSSVTKHNLAKRLHVLPITDCKSIKRHMSKQL